MATGIRINGSNNIEVTIGKLVLEETKQLSDPDLAFGLFFNLSELTPAELAALKACIAKMGEAVNFVAAGQSHKKDVPVEQTEEEEEPEE